MFDRADAVLAAIPLLAVSGVALRGAIVATGVATGLLAAPLATLGPVAAGVVMIWTIAVTRPGGAASSGS